MISNSLLRTIPEQEVNPYPNNIVNASYWYKWDGEQNNPDKIVYYIPKDKTLENTHNIQRCDLLRKINDEYYEDCIITVLVNNTK